MLSGAKKKNKDLLAITFACSLKACASLGDIVKGRELHSD